MLLLAMLFSFVASSGFPAGPKTTQGQCTAVSFVAKLKAGNNFKQKVDDLEFEIRASTGMPPCGGWYFTLDDAAGHDFIYPVNMPLRFNPSQNLGCSYGLTAQQGLEMKRSMRFLLTEHDYLRLYPLMRDALWPGDSPDPEHAAGTYIKAITEVPTGLIRIETEHFKISKSGVVHSAEFKVELIAPASFAFGQALKPHSTACPAN